MIRDQWIERAREAMQEFVDRCDRGEVRSRYTYEKLRALLAEPDEPEYQPGQEVPGWFAARLASEGRANEWEWKGESWSEWTDPLHCLPPGAAFSGHGCYRFRLRPAPTPPEPVRCPDGTLVDGPRYSGDRPEPESEHGPGHAVPGWVAHEYAAKGLAAAVEWNGVGCPDDQRGPFSLLEFTPHWDDVVEHPSNYHFYLRPCPRCLSGPATSRAAFEEAMERGTRHVEAFTTARISPEQLAIMADHDALRALADDHARRAIDTAERYDRLVEKYRLLAEEVAELRHLMAALEDR